MSYFFDYKQINISIFKKLAVPFRDRMLVERLLFPQILRAVGTQYVCLHKGCVPTARCFDFVNPFSTNILCLIAQNTTPN